MRAVTLGSLVCFSSLTACQAVVGPGISYVDCFRSPDGKDAETFETRDEQPGVANCWRIDNTRKPASIRAVDGDLVVHPYAEVGAVWNEDAQAPFFYRTVAGDFLLVARAEAVSTVPGTDHCLADGEAAGLAVRRAQPLAWATLLVRPDLPPDAPLELCGDEPAQPPGASVTATSSGFPAPANGQVDGVGADGETDVAVCRHDDQLYFLYRDATERRENPALDFQESFGPLEVGLGPLDVGVSATAKQGAKTAPEGHFNWLVLEEFADAAPADGCNGALEDFVYPESE